jgi:hypothetical protein
MLLKWARVSIALSISQSRLAFNETISASVLTLLSQNRNPPTVLGEVFVRLASSPAAAAWRLARSRFPFRVHYYTKDSDYGLWSIFVEEEGLSVRIVFNDKSLLILLANIEELLPDFQESYMTHVACKDCVHCGKHVFYTHGDHVHRLCKSPWWICVSPIRSRSDS